MTYKYKFEYPFYVPEEAEATLDATIDYWCEEDREIETPNDIPLSQLNLHVEIISRLGHWDSLNFISVHELKDQIRLIILEEVWKEKNRWEPDPSREEDKRPRRDSAGNLWFWYEDNWQSWTTTGARLSWPSLKAIPYEGLTFAK